MRIVSPIYETTSDSHTLKEAMKSTEMDQDFWILAIDGRFSSLGKKEPGLLTMTQKLNHFQFIM